MELDESYTEPWREAEEYFESRGFELEAAGIDAEAKGSTLEEAVESLPDSIYGTMRFKREANQLVFVYNPAHKTGVVELRSNDRESEEEASEYAENLEDILDGEINFNQAQD